MEAVQRHSKRCNSSDSHLFAEASEAVHSHLLAEAAVLLSAPAKCKDLWSALQIADYKKEGVLNEAAVIVLFEKEREKFKELLLVNTSEELVQLLDEFEDGNLTEDEQILIFSLIKERMQRAAEGLCVVHEYPKYREMMQAIRDLERDIVEYQEVLRAHTQKREMTAYRELGQEKAGRFTEDWNRRLRAFEEENQRRVEELRRKHATEMLELERSKLPTTARPSARLRNLQVEERLVAINERFYEAAKIRRELQSMEQEETEKMTRKEISEFNKLRRKLEITHIKEMRQLQQRLQTAYNRLIIERHQQSHRLRKEITHHLNDITKQHSLSKKIALHIGRTRDELRRTKQKSKEMMKVMSEAKIVPSTRTRHASERTERPITSLFSTLRTAPGTSFSSPLREHLRSVTRFNICTEDTTGEGPVNGPMQKGKLAQELAGKRTAKTALRSLGELYNAKLEEL